MDNQHCQEKNIARLIFKKNVCILGHHFNMNYSVNYWVGQGAKRSQLLLGLATYGRGFTLTNPVSVSISSSMYYINLTKLN